MGCLALLLEVFECLVPVDGEVVLDVLVVLLGEVFSDFWVVEEAVPGDVDEPVAVEFGVFVDNFEAPVECVLGFYLELAAGGEEVVEAFFLEFVDT